MQSRGVLSLPDDLLKVIRNYLSFEDILELRTTASRCYVNCHAEIKTINIHGSFPSNLVENVGFNGINFKPQVIRFRQGSSFKDSNILDFIKTFGTNCRELEFYEDPGAEILSIFLENLPRLINCYIQVPKGKNTFDGCTEAAKVAIGRLKAIYRHDNNITKYYKNFGLSIIERMPNIECLVIPIYFDDHSNERYLDIIRTANNLHTLRLMDSNLEFYTELCGIPNLRLKELIIDWSLEWGLPESSVRNFLQLHPELKALDLMISSIWSNDIFNFVGTTLKDLGTFRFIGWSMDEILDFSFLDTLKVNRLSVNTGAYHANCIENGHVLGLESANYPYVTNLWIREFYDNLCEGCITKLIMAFPNVRVLRLENLFIDQHMLKEIFSIAHLEQLRIYHSVILGLEENQEIYSNLKIFEVFNGNKCSKWISGTKFPQLPELKYLKITGDKSAIELPVVYTLIEKCPSIVQFSLFRIIPQQKLFNTYEIDGRCRPFKCSKTFNGRKNIRALFDRYYATIDEKMVRMIFEKVPYLDRIEIGEVKILRQKLSEEIPRPKRRLMVEQ